MNKNVAHAWFLPALMIVLGVWGLLLALGAFLGWEFWETPREVERPAVKRPLDYRKPIIVAGCVGVFVGGWGLALWSRQRRLARRPSKPEA